jgi:hypothetical protein
LLSVYQLKRTSHPTHFGTLPTTKKRRKKKEGRKEKKNRPSTADHSPFLQSFTLFSLSSIQIPQTQPSSAISNPDLTYTSLLRTYRPLHKHSIASLVTSCVDSLFTMLCSKLLLTALGGATAALTAIVPRCNQAPDERPGHANIQLEEKHPSRDPAFLTPKTNSKFSPL